MVRILVSLFMIIGGLALVFLALYDTTKKSIKMNSKDIIVPKKSHYSQRLLDLITGFWFIVVGIIAFLNLLPAEYIGILSTSILLLTKIIEFIINRGDR